MVFTSFNFLLFFPIVFILFYLTPVRYRWTILLISSYFFYINIQPVYTLIVVFVTLSTYTFARLMDGTSSDSRKKMFMRINLFSILLPLFFFKYFGAINESIFVILEHFNIKVSLPQIRLLLPIGISYYTFMAIGYTIDVYNEEIKPEKNIGILALFISFFPLILSGPIERAKNMIPQFRSQNNLNYVEVVRGFKFLLWGYFMKLVVADRIGIYVDAIYNNIEHHNGTSLLFASFLYPFQVYADLGGYSLIAIGISRLLGITVMQNFNRPFFATSMSEFWRRWHISLILWLTDYVYTPLSFAFRKYKIWGIVISLMVTFFLSGIWHEATLPFAIWGVMQGIFLSIEALMKKNRTMVEKKYNLKTKKWYLFVGMLITFILFASSEVFSRVSNVEEAMSVYFKIFTDWGALFIGGPKNFMYIILGLGILLLKDFMDEFMPTKFLFFENKNKVIRLMAYSSIIILILLFGVFDGGQFIYFQF